jgi:hypothetical protein
VSESLSQGIYGRHEMTSAEPAHDDIDSSLFRWSICLCAAIIAANTLIGIFAPTLFGLDDEIQFLDTLWRTVLGQRVGIDFHNPLGFGPFQLGALLWYWLGPHYYVMRLAIALFSLTIALCGCIVAKRTLGHRPNLALLFCVTLAFQLSTPTIYESTRTALSMSGYYDRHVVSALAVLFLLTFGGALKSSKRDNAIVVALGVCLLNVMFLTKILGFLLGLMILLAGCLLPNRTGRRLFNLCAALVAFVVITTIEFKATGLEFMPVVQEYELAAKVRLTYSYYDIVRGIFSGPFVGSLALLVFFAISRRARGRRLDFWCGGLIIGTYAVCQFAINITNGWGVNIGLAPAAAASLVVCAGLTADPQQIADGESWWQRFAVSRLAEISVREAVPIVIFMLVLIPEVVASIVGITIGMLVSLEIEGPAVVVTAGKGVSFRSLPWPGLDSPVYVNSLNDAVAAITSLKLDHEAIANLDFANPFPVLFLAPPPKGTYNILDVFFNTLRDWREVIGSACVVTVPKQPSSPEVTVRFIDIMGPKFASDFSIVYRDALWSIYRRSRDCATAPD